MTRSVDDAVDRLLRDHYGRRPEEEPADDPQFDAEVAAIMAQGDAAIFAGVQRPKRRWRLVWGGVLAAAAAALFATWSSTRMAAPTGELTPVVRGAIAEVRSPEEAPVKTPRFTAGGRAEIEFVQPRESTTVPALALYVFSVENGILRALPARVARSEDNSQIRFTVEAEAHAMMAFAFVAAGARADQLDGTSWEDAQNRDGLRWSTQRLEIVTAPEDDKPPPGHPR